MVQSNCNISCYTFAMRRKIIIFLMFLLPMQFSWAAVSAYCEHEAQVASKHIGHHDHKHQSKPSNTDDSAGSESKSSNFDADCGVCHAGCLVALSDVTVLLDFVSADVTFLRPLTRHLPWFSAKPERPKWLRLA